MQNCDHFSSGRCRSCGLLAWPVQQRFPEKMKSLDALIAEFSLLPNAARPVVVDDASGTRCKAKLAVGGTLDEPLLGMVNASGEITDLVDCPLHHPVLNTVAIWIKEHINHYKLVPYDIKSRRGEFKYVILRVSQDGASVMVRFVMRSTEAVPRIRKLANVLMEQFPRVALVSVNIQPKPAALIEGDEEWVISDQSVLWETYNNLTLAFGPQAFSQVTPVVATQLYQKAAEILQQYSVESMLDLFCGVGGFALHAAEKGIHGVGVEYSKNAVDCAASALSKNKLEGWAFHAADVLAFLQEQTLLAADAILVNPPRRGLGMALTQEIQKRCPRLILYSSCNVLTLIEDLAALTSSYRVAALYPFDMFPGTPHWEVLAVLERC